MHNLVLVCCVSVMCWSADYHVTVIQGGLSALMLCCESGNCEMAELLLKSQADPDLQQSVSHPQTSPSHVYMYIVYYSPPQNTGYTAVMFACKGGHLDTVFTLLDNSANTSIRKKVSLCIEKNTIQMVITYSIYI